MTFPSLLIPPPQIADPGKVRLGDGSITAQFPPLRVPPPAIADPGIVRLGDGSITAGFPRMTRRKLFGSVSLVPLAALAALPGCSGVAAVVALAPQIASYAGTIANAIMLILPSIQTLTGLAGGAYNTIASLAGQVQAAATKVAGAAVGDAAALVSIVSNGAATIVGKLTNLPSLPGVVATVLANITALWPALEALVGITTPTPAPTVAALVAGRSFAIAVQILTPEQAYANLQAFLAAQHV